MTPGKSSKTPIVGNLTTLAPAAPPAPPVAPTGGEETIEKDINFTKKIEFWKFFWFFWMIYEEIEHILYYEISLLINLLLKHLLKSQFWIFLWFFLTRSLAPAPTGRGACKVFKNQCKHFNFCSHLPLGGGHISCSVQVQVMKVHKKAP